MMKWASFSWVIVSAIIAVGLALAYALDFTRRRRLMEKIGHAPQLAKMAASVSEGKRVAKAVLIVLGVFLLAFALAGPSTRGRPIWKQRGIDVAVVMDFSKSMLARDVYPSRIERSKYMVDGLLDKFAGNRVAVVAFGGGAVHYPVTTDYEAAKTLYQGLDPRDMAPGSDLGEAVLTARCLLLGDEAGEAECQGVRGGDREREQRAPSDEATEERARAIVIFTDGEDTEGHGRAEVERAAKLGLAVYVVGVGTKTGGRIPEYDENGDIRGWKLAPDGQSYFTTRLDDEGLKALAKAAGGDDHYLRDDPHRFSMDAIVKSLSELKEGNLEKRVDEDRVRNDRFEWVLFPAFLLLLIEACLGDRKRAVAIAGAASGAPVGPVRRRRRRA